jgi:putative flippase GtrA
MQPLTRLTGEIGRFAIVGAVATAVHIGAATVFLHSIAHNPLVANLAAFLIAVAVSFLGHYHWSFASRLSKTHAFLRFFAVALIGFAANSALLKALLLLNFSIADVSISIAALIVPIISFTLSRIWAFAPRTTPSGS